MYAAAQAWKWNKFWYCWRVQHQVYFGTRNPEYLSLKKFSVTNEDGKEIFKIPAHDPYEKNSDELDALLHTLHDLPSE